MAKDSELNMTLKYILGFDISFVIDDIIGDYVDPNIPVNIDQNFSIDVDTPYGICNMATKYVEDHYEVIFKRFISEAYYAEYKLNLNPHDKNFLYLEGKIIESREKGYIISNIEKLYGSKKLIKGSEENRQINKNDEIIINSINYVIKKQRVYPKKGLYRYGVKWVENKPLDQLSTDFGYFIDYYYWLEGKVRQYMTTVSMYKTICSFGETVAVIIDDFDCSWLYPMLDGDNIVGRAYNLYEGIINQENYNDALNLIKSSLFSKSFAHEDYNEGISSINERIADLVGNPTFNFREEYSSYVNDVVDKYYNLIQNKFFLFKKFILAKHVKISELELEKNRYIKQIRLSNRSNFDNKRKDANGKR